MRNLLLLWAKTICLTLCFCGLVAGCAKQHPPKEKTYAEELERQKKERQKEMDDSIRDFLKP